MQYAEATGEDATNELEPSGIPGGGYEVDSDGNVVGVFIVDDQSQAIGVRDRGQSIELLANPSLDTGARVFGRTVRVGRVVLDNDGIVTSANVSIGSTQIPPAIGTPIVRWQLGPQPAVVRAVRAFFGSVNSARRGGGI